MQKYLIFGLPLSLMLLCRCSMEPAHPNFPTMEVQSIRLLLLLEERQLEIWTQDSLSFSKWTSFPLQTEVDYPIGRFDVLMENDSLSIDFKNDYYGKKTQLMLHPIVKDKYDPILSLLHSGDAKALSQISALAPEVNLLVVPNDTRNGGQFKPCRNCPSWMPELYSQLQLELLDFSKPNLPK
jgi:hypothetical protein